MSRLSESWGSGRRVACVEALGAFQVCAVPSCQSKQTTTAQAVLRPSTVNKAAAGKQGTAHGSTTSTKGKAVRFPHPFCIEMHQHDNQRKQPHTHTQFTPASRTQSPRAPCFSTTQTAHSVRCALHTTAPSHLQHAQKLRHQRTRVAARVHTQPPLALCNHAARGRPRRPARARRRSC